MASPASPPEVDDGGAEEDPGKRGRPSVGLIIYGLVAALVIVMGVVSSFQRAGLSPDLRTKAT